MPRLHPDHRCDILVIGAGIAGASAAAALSSDADVIVIEAEDQPGYHTTGRSAAFYAESYGGPLIQPLTSASKDFYLHTPAGFADVPLVHDRGCLHLYSARNKAKAKARAEALAARLPAITRLCADEVLARVPVLRPQALAGAIWDPDCRDLDVATIHQGYLRQMRRHGGRLICDARLSSLSRQPKGFYAQTGQGTIAASMVINAAGAWGDEVARMAGLSPIGLSPKRRTALVFKPEKTAVMDDWPLVIDFAETIYFKPEQGRILASPADETPMPPCDVQPDEMDIALTIDRLEKLSTLDVPKILNRWAGLRSFAPDRAPVVGPDGDCGDFIWCVGQGGYGIQTAPAMAALTKARALGRDLPDGLAGHDVRAACYDPARFRHPKL
ncbi:dimethylglycine dehydrogenase, mitochondrial [alpha proteobacterium Q-1]|nr:dimethylglycine dehydrogenase, mitochondrial [alpha proteobacterium Q-1]